MNDSIYAIMSDVEKKCKLFGNEIWYKSVGSRKNMDRRKEWTDAAYEKAFNEEISQGIKDVNNVLIKWITNEKDLKIEDIDNISKIVKNNLFSLINNLAELVFSTFKIDRDKILKISKGSVLSRISKIDKENMNTFVSTRDIQSYNEIINQIENTDSLDQSLNKISSFNTPLVKLIKNIFDSNLSDYDHQVALDKCLIEYELDFLSQNNPETRNSQNMTSNLS